MAQIEVKDLTKRFGSVTAVDAVNLTFTDEKLTVLVGPSGCGKTTLMRMLAGLEEPSSGEIYVDGKSVTDVPVWDRNIAMVFQNYALYPHMTVYQNLAFPLESQKMTNAQRRSRIESVAGQLGIAELLARKPRQLSGGQMQRVALGRAIVREPQVFLMDEPLSNLDAELRVSTRTEIKRLQRQTQTTTVYVTHDQIEAMTLADTLVIMKSGCVQQVGTPQDVYDWPANIFVGGFLGSPAMNFMNCTYVDGRLSQDGIALIVLKTPVDLPAQITLGVRPEHIQISTQDDREMPRGHVLFVEPIGKENILSFKTDAGQAIKAIVPTQMSLEPGQTIWWQMSSSEIHLFDRSTQQRLN